MHSFVHFKKNHIEVKLEGGIKIGGIWIKLFAKDVEILFHLNLNKFKIVIFRNGDNLAKH